MRPALREGQGLLSVRSRRAKVGQLRVLEHPLRPGFWLVKRVSEVLPGERMRVLSDDPSATDADSRDFGSVPVAGSYRVLVVL
jgi:hypothetical protein